MHEPSDRTASSLHTFDAPADRTERLRALIAALPKAELHVHIEGTLEPELMLELARRNNIILPYADVEAAKAARGHYGSLQDFLNEFELGLSVLCTEQDFADLAAAYFSRAAEQNVTNVELFFDPMLHVARGVPLESVIGGLRRAAEASRARHGLLVQLLMCFNRDRGPEAAARMLQLARPHLGHIAGVGLDSAEAGWPPRLFEGVFREAARLGLRRFAHAGEEGGPDYVWEAIRQLHVQRVDHGIRSLEDPALMAHLERAQLPLTLCPLSNLRLQVYAGALERRLRQLLSSRVLVTINSDDPAYFGGYINENYEYVARVANLSARQLADLACASFRAAFLSRRRAAAACGAVEAALAAWERGGLGVERQRESAVESCEP